MNYQRFGGLVRSLSSRPSRRHLLAGLAGAVLGPSPAWLSHVASAKKKRKKWKKKKATFNDFGCVNVGGYCKKSGQCCSGLCQGKKGRNLQTCQDHGASTCQGEDACLDELNYVACTAATGAGGQCLVTTGNASYCGASVRCHTCAQDGDCVSVCGAGAACIDCADPDCLGLGYRTACAGTVANGCYSTI